jgi:hypothetical protein
VSTDFDFCPSRPPGLFDRVHQYAVSVGYVEEIVYGIWALTSFGSALLAGIGANPNDPVALYAHLMEEMSEEVTC